MASREVEARDTAERSTRHRSAFPAKRIQSQMSEVQQLGNRILEIEDIGERLRVGYSSYCNACYPITHTPVLTLTDKMCKSVLF